MSWMNHGYDSMENAYDNVPKAGGGPKRVWMPPRQTKRILFMDDAPTTFWEHQFFFNGSFKNWEPCHLRNQIDPICPICDSIPTMAKPSYPYFIGMHSVIVMSPFRTKKDNILVDLQRQIFAAKMGSERKPGILKKLERIKAKHGRLKGLVFDVFREGDMSEGCGNEFELVEDLSVEPNNEAIEALRDKIVPKYIEARNKGMEGDKILTMEKWLEWNPWKPFNFEEEIKPRENKELNAMGFGHGNKPHQPAEKEEFQDGGSSYGGGSDKDKSPYGEDDDVPY